LIEDRTWTRDALTAPEVISLQVFRDLFAAATLRPGDEAGVSQVALLFTDLQGSTALYERVGDAVAFNMVREPFALLAGVVRDHDGAVVKTIGDAVMASFGDPANAVKAALAMQARIADHDLVLKLGVHVGPSVVVNMNDRLDYFGSTVNMAARLQGQSQGGDIVLSRAVADDPAVRPLLATLAARRESVALKGFAHPISFVRLTPSPPASSRGRGRGPARKRGEGEVGFRLHDPHVAVVSGATSPSRCFATGPFLSPASRRRGGPSVVLSGQRWATLSYLSLSPITRIRPSGIGR